MMSATAIFQQSGACPPIGYAIAERITRRNSFVDSRFAAALFHERHLHLAQVLRIITVVPAKPYSVQVSVAWHTLALEKVSRKCYRLSPAGGPAVCSDGNHDVRGTRQTRSREAVDARCGGDPCRIPFFKRVIRNGESCYRTAIRRARLEVSEKHRSRQSASLGLYDLEGRCVCQLRLVFSGMRSKVRTFQNTPCC
jgi:hypothetical protein